MAGVAAATAVENAQLLAELRQNSDVLAERSTRLAERGTTLESMNQELEDMLFIASHDLRAPLINIDGFMHEPNGLLDRLEITEVVTADPQCGHLLPSAAQRPHRHFAFRRILSLVRHGILLLVTRAAHSVGAPLPLVGPCGEGLGVGVVVVARGACLTTTPPPRFAIADAARRRSWHQEPRPKAAYSLPTRGPQGGG